MTADAREGTEGACGAFDPVAYINEPRWRQSKPGLERMEALLDAMGDPQRILRFVHVAGTNGKGSVCAYLASILQQAGYRTGLFTSPYVVEFAERIRVDGCNIGDGDLMAATLLVRDCAAAVESRLGEHPTEFELMCAVALEHFKRSRCDIVVMEVGLGGRLDATNAIPAPEVAVITRIGLDHTEFLGDTLEAIAREKTGIVKPGSAVVAWPQEDAGAREAIRTAAAAAGDPLTVVDFSSVEAGPIAGSPPVRSFSFEGIAYDTALLGSYQPFNAAVALTAAEALASRGFPAGQQARQCGIARTRWPGRFQLIEAGPPPVVVDGGHNPQGARALAESLQDAFPGRPVVFIMGVLADKDYPAMIGEVASLAKAFICVTPPNPRALPARDLAAALGQCFAETAGAIPPIKTAATMEEALVEARRQAAPDDVIAAFGSLYALSPLLAPTG